MATATATTHIDARPQQVWDAIGDPARIAEFAPFLETSSVDGDARACELVGGGTVRELIVTHDPANHRYVYAVREAPFPLDFHRAEVRLEPDGDGTRLTWTADVKPDEVAEKMQPNLDAVVAGAASLFATSSSEAR